MPVEVTFRETLSRVTQPLSLLLHEKAGPCLSVALGGRSGQAARSAASTPGIGFRLRMSVLSARAPWPAGLRNEKCHRHMDVLERHDGRHGAEMHNASRLVTAQQSRELLQLHRFPDRKARQEGHHARE